MEIGFTGTRNELTPKALNELTLALIDLKDNNEITMCHHGDCTGADVAFHNICTQLGLSTMVHPPIRDDLRAYCKGTHVRSPLGYFERNRVIVTLSDILFGCPWTMEETEGGTWYTINYAKEKSVPVQMVWPEELAET